MERYDPRVTPWSIRAEDFPTTGTLHDKLGFLIRYAILAPSSRNTQPWQFRVTAENIEVFSDLSRWQKVADSDQRELHISIGCAIENILIAAVHHGLSPTVTYFPTPGNPVLVAAISFSQPGVSGGLLPGNLFLAITDRLTNHKEFRTVPLAPADLDAVRRVRVDEGVHLWLSEERGVKREVNELVNHADRVLFDVPAFRDELGHWIGQGVFGTPWLVSVLGSWAVSNLKLGTFRADSDQDLLWSAPVFGVISSEKDDRESHVLCGQALERVYLTAAAHRVSIHPFSQIIEVVETRAKLAHMLPEQGLHPQQAFRLGYADPETSHTPRRAAEEVLI